MPTQTCQHCFATENLQVCAKCRTATYCNTDCQGKARPRHSKDCDFEGSQQIHSKKTRYQRLAKRFGTIVDLVNQVGISKNVTAVGLDWNEIRDSIDYLTTEEQALKTLFTSNKWSTFLEKELVIHSLNELVLASDRLETYESIDLKSTMQVSLKKCIDMNIGLKSDQLFSYPELFADFANQVQKVLKEILPHLDEKLLHKSQKAVDALHNLLEEVLRTGQLLKDQGWVSHSILVIAQKLSTFLRTAVINPLSTVYERALTWGSNVFSILLAHMGSMNPKERPVAGSIVDRAHHAALYVAFCLTELKKSTLSKKDVDHHQKCLAVGVKKIVEIVRLMQSEMDETLSERLLKVLGDDGLFRQISTESPRFVDRTWRFLDNVVRFFEKTSDSCFSFNVSVFGAFIAGPANLLILHLTTELRNQQDLDLDSYTQGFEEIRNDADTVIQRSIPLAHPLVPRLIELRKEIDSATEKAVDIFATVSVKRREAVTWSTDSWESCGLLIPLALREEVPAEPAWDLLEKWLSPELLRLVGIYGEMAEHIYALEVDRVDDLVPVLTPTQIAERDAEARLEDMEEKNMSTQFGNGAKNRDRSPTRGKTAAQKKAAAQNARETAKAEAAARAELAEQDKLKKVHPPSELALIPSQPSEEALENLLAKSEADAVLGMSSANPVATALNQRSWPVRFYKSNRTKILMGLTSVGTVIVVGTLRYMFFQQEKEIWNLQSKLYDMWKVMKDLPGVMNSMGIQLREFIRSLNLGGLQRCDVLFKHCLAGRMVPGDINELYSTGSCLPKIDYIANVTQSVDLLLNNSSSVAPAIDFLSTRGIDPTAYTNLPGAIDALVVDPAALHIDSDKFALLIKYSGVLAWKEALATKFMAQALFLARSQKHTLKAIIEGLPAEYQFFFNVATASLGHFGAGATSPDPTSTELAKLGMASKMSNDTIIIPVAPIEVDSEKFIHDQQVEYNNSVPPLSVDFSNASWYEHVTSTFHLPATPKQWWDFGETYSVSILVGFTFFFGLLALSGGRKSTSRWVNSTFSLGAVGFVTFLAIAYLFVSWSYNSQEWGIDTFPQKMAGWFLQTFAFAIGQPLNTYASTWLLATQTAVLKANWSDSWIVSAFANKTRQVVEQEILKNGSGDLVPWAAGPRLLVANTKRAANSKFWWRNVETGEILNNGHVQITKSSEYGQVEGWDSGPFSRVVGGVLRVFRSFPGVPQKYKGNGQIIKQIWTQTDYDNPALVPLAPNPNQPALPPSESPPRQFNPEDYMKQLK